MLSEQVVTDRREKYCPTTRFAAQKDRDSRLQRSSKKAEPGVAGVAHFEVLYPRTAGRASR